MKISVIMPIYNAEQYLPRCIDSLLNQTMTDFELLCIDDGSTDSSSLIVKRYMQYDDRIKLFSQENKGVSAARNYGIDYASGEYIAFVDADDWVEPDYLEWLYNAATQRNVKVAVCGHDIMTDENYIAEQGKETGLLFQNAALEIALRPDGYQGYLWNKLFHRSLFSETGIRLHQEIFLLEDLLCVCQCIMQVSHIYYEPVVKYHYNQSAGSTYRFSEKSVTMFHASCELMKLFQDNEYTVQLKMAKCWHSQSAGAAYLYYAAHQNPEKAAFYKKEQKQYLKEYLWCNKKRPKQLLRGILITYMPQLAVWLKNKK